LGPRCALAGVPGKASFASLRRAPSGHPNHNLLFRRSGALPSFLPQKPLSPRVAAARGAGGV
jgi:hypothetical protein